MKKILLSIAGIAAALALPLVASAAATVTAIATGTTPIYTATDPASGSTYVVNTLGQSVDVINSANRKIATIALDGVPYYGPVTLDPVARKLFVPFQRSNSGLTVEVISTVSNSIVARLTLGTRAGVSMYDPDNGLTYLVYQAANGFHLAGIGSANSVVSDVLLSSSGIYSGIAYNSSNKSVYLADALSSNQTVRVFNPASGAITNIPGVPASSLYQTVVYEPVHHLVYVGSETNPFSGAGTVSVIDDTTLVKTLQLPNNTYGLQLGNNPVTGVVYVGASPPNSSNGQVWTVTGSAFGPILNIPGATPTGFAYNSANGNTYVTTSGSSDQKAGMSIISAGNAVIGSINLSPYLQTKSVLFNASNGQLYVPVTGPSPSFKSFVLAIKP